ncbi:MAG: ABC transporter permease [Candidatus Hydrogenedentota bacterium]
MSHSRYRTALIALGVALPVVLLISAGLGAYFVAPWDIPRVLAGSHDEAAFRVLAYIRFPRVVLSALVGAALAVAGAGMQGLFRNPLADPQLVGVTGGAAAGASISIVFFGAAGLGLWTVPVAAFLGSCLAVTVVLKIAQLSGTGRTATLLLTGIAVNAIAFACIGLMITYANDQQLRDITFWQLGGFSHSTWPLVLASAVFMAVGIVVLLRLGSSLNALALGDREAFHLGISLPSVQRRLVVASALVVGAAVSAAGSIGFVGLITPHMLRLTMGADHRWLLPASALGGAILLTLADLAARTIAMPTEIPVGIITAIAGGPFFIWLILRNGRRHSHA